MRGVSSIVVMVLLLLIALSLSTMLYLYMSDAQGQLTGIVDSQQDMEMKKASSSMKILGFDPNSGNITIRNTGRFDLRGFNLFLNDIQTGIKPIEKLSPGDTCIISTLTKLSPGDYMIKITASYATAESFMTIPGGPAPSWSMQSENETTGTDIELSVSWTDDIMVSYATLSTNETGVWQDKASYHSPKNINAQTGWSNFSWKNSSINDGTVIAWRVWANDTDGNVNTTSTMTFIKGQQASPGTPNPKWFNPAVSKLVTYSDWKDAETEIDFTWLSTDETGIWRNYTAREASVVIDDMMDNTTWVKSVPWNSPSITTFMYNSTDGYIRDGTKIGVSFIGVSPCENGTTRHNIQPAINMNEYVSIDYWVNPIVFAGPTLTGVVLGSSSNGGYCFSPTAPIWSPTWSKIELVLDFTNQADPTKFHDDKSKPFCDPSQIDTISIYFTGINPEGMPCNQYEMEYLLDELYLRKPSHNDFTTMFTWKNESITAGTNVRWKIYANDTDGYQNVTSEGTVTAP